MNFPCIEQMTNSFDWPKRIELDKARSNVSQSFIVLLIDLIPNSCKRKKTQPQSARVFTYKVSQPLVADPSGSINYRSTILAIAF